jgi:hypothetical protein
MASVLIPAAAALILAVLCLPRLRKDPRQAVTVPEPERIATVTAVVIDPSQSATRPFAYDNGLITGPGTEGP